MKKAKPFLIASLFFSLVLGGCGNSKSFAPKPGPEFSLMDSSGKTVTLSQYKGKVLLLDFWATWCPPCRASIPALKELNKEYEGKEFDIVGMNLDEDPSVVTPFMEQIGINYKILLAGHSDVAERYGVQGIPAFFLLNQKGEVVKKWTGFAPSYAKEWRQAIDQLLAH